MSNAPINRRAQMAEARRDAVLAAAKQEFVAKGFAAARVEDIAKRAGVAKGTVYLSFPDKEQLFEGVISAQMAPLADRIRGRLSGGGEGALRAAMEPLLMAMLQEVFSGETGPVLRLLISEAIRFPRLGERYRREVVEPTLNLLGGLLQRAAASGELRNPEVAAVPQLIMAPMIMGLIWQGAFADASPLDMQRVLKVHLDNLFVA